MEQRQVMYYGGTQTDKLLQPQRRYYSADGSMEITYTLPVGATPASVEILAFVGGDAYSAPIVWKSVNAATPSYFYLHRDNQSSILAITNATGTVVEKRLFDPWGNVLAVQNGAGVALAKMMFFDRGYTGHEHLQGVGLINMNARLYDAKLHRFLQADDFLQDPSNTQNYNRYAYCVNNPLRYTDPSGNIFGIDDILISAIIVAALIGAGVGVAVYVGTSLYYGTPITAGGIIGAAIIGAVSGAVTCGIGDAATSTFANFYSRAAFQALSHGAFQGTLSSIQGGNFCAGFLAGALSSIASSAWGGGKSYDVAGDKGVAVAGGFKGLSGFAHLNNTAGTLFFGALAGGAGASLGGGNFWQGAVTGLVVAGLNHTLHYVAEGIQLKGEIESKYPGLYKTLSKLKSFVKGNESVMSEFTSISGYSKSQTLNLLSLRNLARIVVIVGTSEWGQFFGNKNLKSFDPDHVHIRADVATNLDNGGYNESGGYGKVSLFGSSFFAGVTVLHELVHFGRYWNGLPQNYTYGNVTNYEAGQIFEKWTFGAIQTYGSSTESAKKYGW